MKGFDHKLIDYILKRQSVPLVFAGDFGLEKENVRVDETGKLALTPHPSVFGDKLKNPYITTDFSESQVEMITPVCGSIQEVYNFLANLQNIVSLSLEDEYLWPQSNPPVLPGDEDIPIANFAGDGLAQTVYREKLAKKYGKKKQLLSGIHFNFSFKDELIMILHEKFGLNKSCQEFKNDLYLKITRSFLKYRWLLIYLTGSSPVVHYTYGNRPPESIEKIDKIDNESYCYRNLCSLRNSRCGYKNNEDFAISYSSLDDYVMSIQTLIDQGKIEGASELYTPIRLKAGTEKGGLGQLESDGIQYLELRFLDLNPFAQNGVNIDDLYLVHLFMIFLLFLDDSELTTGQQEMADRNHDLATVAGMQREAKIYNEAGELVSLREEALKILIRMEELVRELDFDTEHLTGILKNAGDKVVRPEKTYAARLIEMARKYSFIGFHMKKAKEYLEQSRSRETGMVGYEDLELSTQILIKTAVRSGVKFEILDRRENFLGLSNGTQVEYVKQATKTSRDTYSSVLIMENKVVTKALLREHNFRVPGGEHYDDFQYARHAYPKYKGRSIVVKPKSTNFGLGISILKHDFSEAQFLRALEIAFNFDKTVLIEEFIAGREFRFLVIGDEVVGVLQRLPANVQGDGKKNIRELVTDKNTSPLRGEGHRTPLEKIVLGEIEETYLNLQGKDFETVPEAGETVFLRENSNISTGGDSIDYTDIVHESYKETALKAAKCIGASITGVDMIIEEVKETRNNINYAIIELNFNPAVYMHCYPYKGQNRNVLENVLNLLFDK